MEILILLVLAVVALPFILVLASFGFLGWKLLGGAAWAGKRLFAGAGSLVGHVGTTLRDLVLDVFRSVGALLTAILFVPLVVVNTLLFRFHAVGHYARACEDELWSFLLGLYRVALSHPLRLVGLGVALDGLERRLPEAVDREPVSPRKRMDAFEGYKITGTLPAGGSGATLFLAKPTRDKLKSWQEAGMAAPERVVIKSFALEQGSTLPQILRESRALESAARLGLVQEHELAAHRFHYVTEFVDGEELGAAVQRLHGEGGPDGLNDAGLQKVIAWSRDLLATLQHFHAGGLWHKDVKPANLIVDGDGVRLVDLGLVTPLSAQYTLTTHGTEYYRDPELVRLAMQGVKVAEVNGAKFDLYSAGAVLYSMLEDSFPAQGGLSAFTKRSPEALRWIVRRAMTDIGERYPSAAHMLTDLAMVASVEDPWALKPAELPSERYPEREPDRAAVTPPPLPSGATSPAPKAVRTKPSAARVAAPTSRPHRRRRGRRLAAATVAMGLGLVMATAIAEERESQAYHTYRLHQERLRAQRENRTQVAEAVAQPQRLLPHEAEAFELAVALRDELSDGDTAKVNAPDDLVSVTTSYGLGSAPSRVTRSKTTRTKTLRVPMDRPVMILSEVGAPISAQTRSQIEESLSSQGVKLFGVADQELSTEEAALIADARHAAGLGGLTDERASERLEALLAQHHELGAILWIGATENPKRFRYRLVEGPRTD